MRRLLALTGVLVIALVGAGIAQAGAPPRPNAAFNADNTLTPDAWNVIQDPVRFPPPVPEGTTSADSRTSVLERARRLGRRLPSLKAIGGGSVLLKSTGWSIAASIAFHGYSTAATTLYRSYTGSDEHFGSTTLTTTGSYKVCLYGWKYIEKGGTYGIPPAGTTYAPATGWYVSLRSETDIVSCTTTAPLKEWAVGTNVNQVAAVVAALPNAITLPGCTDGTADDTPSCPSGANLTHFYMTDEMYEEFVESKPITSGEYAAAPSDEKVTPTYFEPAPTSGDEDAAASAYGTPGTQTTVQEDAEADLCEELEEGCASTFVLPAPEANETYTAYITRLQALGWLGSSTNTELGTALEGYGPESPARVIVPGASPGTTRVLDPTNWPSYRLAYEDDIAIRYNPASAAPVPETATPPTTVTGAPTTIPGAPAVDFTPISDIDFGCKFPYGFLTCYAIGFTQLFDVTEDAPVFSFDLGWTGMVNGEMEGGRAPYVVDLNVMDDYMSLWRSILSVCLWVGAVYFVATRFLGFNAGGDPGEAIEDVL